MHLTADRKGNIIEENSLQDRFLQVLYGSRIGRMLLKPMVSPVVSRVGGKLLDTGVSRILIRPFIRSHSIDMTDYEDRRFTSYNDFFKRKLALGARRIDETPETLISPCDSRLSVYKIGENTSFCIKDTFYTVQSLLRDQKLAEKYAGGYIWVFRLCVDDYHRYVYADQGMVSGSRKIPGVFHTVNPAANDQFPIYKENTREYCLLRSENFGTILQMEVGALLVGKIENRPGKRKVGRGEEKGNFAFGGSTVILMTQAGKVIPDEDILRNSFHGMETRVKLGEHVGRK